MWTLALMTGVLIDYEDASIKLSLLTYWWFLLFCVLPLRLLFKVYFYETFDLIFDRPNKASFVITHDTRSI